MPTLEFDRCPRVVLPEASSLEAAAARRDDAAVAVDVPCAGVPALDEVLGPHWRMPDESHRLGANALMLPEQWEGKQEVAERLAISVLHDAAVFGGRISTRDSVTHRGGQALLTSRGELVDDSFGTMDGDLTWSADVFGKCADGLRFAGPREAERLTGDYLFLGSVHRHFGHVMLEGLARLWALDLVRKTSPQCRFLVYEPALEPFARELLELAGVPGERLVCAPAACTVERLFVPRPAMRTHRWITPAMAGVWERIADGCRGDVPTGSPGRRIYLSRKGVENRPCRNEAEVEAWFNDLGFEIVCPEDMAVREQVAMAIQADVLAGTVGSQMYLAAFMARGSRVGVIAPRNFYLKDDLLLASVKGHALRVAFGSPIDFSKKKAARAWHVDLHALRGRLEATGHLSGSSR